MRIVDFLDMSSSSKLVLQHRGSTSKRDDPKLAALLDKSLEYFDADKLNLKIAEVFERNLSKSETIEALAFISSASGAAVADIIHNNPDPEARMKKLSELDPLHRTQAEIFFKSPSGIKIKELIVSPEMKEINRGYGEELMCISFSKNDQVILQKVQASGKCLNI